MLNACLVDDPPEYRAGGRRTPPVLQLNESAPSVLYPIEVRRDDGIGTLDLSVPVRSEDAGDNLLAVLFFDYGTRCDQRDIVELPARTFDVARTIKTTFSYGSLTVTGCHTLTLVVFHESNLTFGQGACLSSADPSDVALATWWVSVDPATPGVLDGCPAPGGAE